MRSKKELAVTLSRLKGFETPKAKLEQYITDSNIAADILWTAYLQGHLKGTVADLGSGTGILGIGALLMGATHVHFVEKDTDAVDICKENLGSIDPTTYSLHTFDIAEFTTPVDVVLQNPPFGTKEEHADRAFLLKAFSLSSIVYTFHKTSTESFVQAIAKDEGYVIQMRHSWDFPLPKTYAFHEKKRQTIEVTCYLLEKEFSKQHLRTLAKERRDELPLAKRMEYSQTIIDSLLGMPEITHAETILLYASFGSEVATHGLIKHLLGKKRIVLPKIQGDELLLYEIERFEQLAPNSLHILEPIAGELVGPSEIDVAVIPLVAFDMRCNRLGYGKGFYDRLLPQMHALTIGLAFEEQKVARIPVDRQDVSLNRIITEKQMY